MAAESTFDIVSDFDRQELVNAVDQAQREVRTRYDLKDTKTTYTLSQDELVIESSDEMSLRSARDVLETKALRRNLSVKIFDYGDPEEIGSMRVRQVVKLQQGLSTDLAKKIQKMIREQFPKIQPRIQGETLRVGSKNKDDLQQVIAYMRERQDELPLPLQFTNYR
jgi:hypothetical protein